MRTVWWVLALGYMGGIFWFSHQTGSGIGLQAPWDKVAHFLEYLGLGLLLSRATGRWTTGWVLAAWYGALDEVHQAFVPGRSSGIDDWFADLLGAWVGSRLGGREPREATPPPLEQPVTS